MALELFVGGVIDKEHSLTCDLSNSRSKLHVSRTSVDVT